MSQTHAASMESTNPRAESGSTSFNWFNWNHPF
jgi:hypothetical protein